MIHCLLITWLEHSYSMYLAYRKESTFTFFIFLSRLLNSSSQFARLSLFLFDSFIILISVMSSQIFKIVVLGEGRVGKTSISLKYVNNIFDDQQESTVNASYLETKITLENKKTVKLAIWDTAGQEKYNAIAPVYYREALGAIVAYEITSRESFEKMKKWVNELEEHAPKGIMLTIAGNKADLESSRKVNNKEVDAFAELHNAKHFVVSAKNGQNISELFEDLSERIYKANFDKKPIGGRGRNNMKLLTEDAFVTKPEKKKKCCSSS